VDSTVSSAPALLEHTPFGRVERPMKSIRSKLVLALSLVELSSLGMAAMLYVGSGHFEANARSTREANDDLRELLDFSLVSHGYMEAFGRSLGQRTLIANRDRREAAAAFEQRSSKIPEMHLADSGLSTLNWQELQQISSELGTGLRAADAFRAQGDFMQAERRFAEARQTVFGQRMLPWFEQAIAALRGDALARELSTQRSATQLRLAGVLFALASSAFASLAVLWMSSSIVPPVRALVAGAEAIRRGDLNHRVRPSSSDEFALVSDSFNRMAETISASQASLLEQNLKLEHAYRMQGEFLSMVTHELRSPLHSIQGYLEFIEEDEPELAGSSRRHLGQIGESARRLLRLVNDILDFSKLEAKQLEVVRARVDLTPLLEESIADARALARDRPVELVLHAPLEALFVESDETRLRQILTNLLSNAVKFTERGAVTLAVSVAAGQIEVAVRDTGVGIPEGQLELIFQPFWQAASVGSTGSRRTPSGGGLTQNDAAPHGATQTWSAASHASAARGGTGLGLAIVARLSELIGARVSVKSEPGIGSEFSISLPRAAAE
jgi:signal transduction histidine kinase